MRLAYSFAAAAALVATPISFGAVAFTGSYTQNFDTALTPTNTTQGTTTAYTDGTTIAGWNFYAEGVTTQATQFWATDGNTTANQQNLPLSMGSSSAFGASAQSDRALGAQTVNGAGTTRAPIHYAVTLTNNTGHTLTNLSLAYNAELWRVPSNEGADTDGLAVDYKMGIAPTNGNAAELAGSTTGWTALAAAAYTQTVAHTGVNQQLDGNVKTTAESASATIAWLAGTTLTIRWTDAAVNGLSQPLNVVQGIDNVAISTPEPAILGVGIVGLLALRRRSGSLSR